MCLSLNKVNKEKEIKEKDFYIIIYKNKKDKIRCLV